VGQEIEVVIDIEIGVENSVVLVDEIQNSPDYYSQQ
jgi:hypothetical protein